MSEVLRTCQLKNLLANATTVLASGPCYLHLVTINTKGASSNTLTIYDNTAASGTKVGTIDTTVGPGTFGFNANLKNGLTVVCATGTAADFTVTWSV